jgi:hypothetical protein
MLASVVDEGGRVRGDEEGEEEGRWAGAVNYIFDLTRNKCTLLR